MKRIGLLLIILLTSLSSQASHLYGGEIWWDCLPNGQYVFYGRIYRDCTGINFNATTITLNSNSPAGNIQCFLQPGYPIDVSPSLSNCTGTNDINCNNPTDGSMEEYLFKSNPLTLNGVPPASGWHFSWSNCNRPAMTNLNGFPCYFLRAYMFPYNDGTGNRNANPCFDNSPEFLEAPKVATCTGYPFSYNNFAFDSELDSLYFDWAQPLDNGFNQPVNFTAPYTFTNPVPGIVNFAQDAGQVDISTTLTGKYATCMRVTAYKFGQKVAEVFRDIPIILLPCAGSTNDPPTLNVINDPLPAPQLTPVIQNGDTAFYEMTVIAGDSIYFRLQSFDDDLINFTPQEITFIGAGGNLGTPLNNPSSCLFNPPCATIEPLSGQTGFASYLQNNVGFSWQTDCDHLSFNPIAGGAARSQYLFYFKMQDNFCPAPSFKLITARINVISPAPVAPDLTNSCLNYDPTSDEVTLDFVGPTAADTAQNFDYYVVYRGDAAGNYVGYDTIYDFTETSYTDVNPDTINRFYYMRTSGGCGQESVSSDTLSVIDLNLAPLPVVNSYVAQLNWSGPFRDGRTVDYEVWRMIDGANTWDLITTTQDTMFNDTVNVCQELLHYQIRIDSACGSFVRQDTFQDNINSDQIEIATVTVTAGDAEVVFPDSPSGDVVEYHILKLVNGAWTTADIVPVGTPMPYIIPGSNADTEAERYRIVSVDSCDNYSDTNAVETHTTIYLDGDLNPCDGIMRLTWNNYINWPGGVDSYSIMADVTPPGGVPNTGVLIGTNAGDDTTFVHENLIPGANYCYYIMAVDTSGNLTSTSSNVCINSNVVVASQLQYLARTTVQNDGSVEVWAFIDGNADVEDYQVQRAEKELGPWITLGVVPQPTAAPYQVKFTDFSASTSSTRYMYRVRSSNLCGGVDTISNLGTNILLEVTANDNLTNQLKWNRYRNYDGNVNYTIYRRNDNAQNWVEVASDVADTNFTDNVRQFGQGNGVFCYRVAAVESNNSLGFTDESGNPIHSFSNEVCLDHDSRGFYPNAFAPNSSVPDNRVWSPQMVFEKDSEYSLSIVNRWGTEVFQSNDSNEGWDGTFRGEEQPEGVYYFIVRYRSVEGKLKEDRGSITLIR